MNNTNTKEPDNEIDRHIFHILAHGQQQQKNIRTLLGRSFNENNVGKRVRRLKERYSWAEEVKEENRPKYYYRTDVSRHPRPAKRSADYSDIDEILSNLEIQLGIRSRTVHNEPSKDAPPILTSLTNLLELSQSKSTLFFDDDHLDRFFSIFDKILEFAEKAYVDDGPGTPSLTLESYNLLFTVAATQLEEWKEGQAHVEFDYMIRGRTDNMLSLLDSVPSEIGIPILRILSMVEVETCREEYKKAVASNNYSVDDLISLGYGCYIVHGDTKQMINDISMASARSGDPDIKQKVRKVVDEINYETGS